MFGVSLISLIGAFFLAVKLKDSKNFLILLVSFSAGSLFGGAFFHLIPETMERIDNVVLASSLVLVGLLIFFALEKIIHWRHCHIPISKGHPHPFAIMNLVGDGLHNFIDGLAIGASYLISIPLGLTTTLAVVIHEIPQEVGDFGVLIHGGFKKSRALFFNFLSGLVAVLGTAIALIVGARVENFSLFLVPIAAGGFIYIAGTDLIPELNKACNIQTSGSQLISLLFGLGIMFALLLI